MNRKSFSVSKSTFGFIQPLVGLVLLVAFVVSLIVLFASRPNKAVSEPQQPISQSFSTTPTTVSQTDPIARWKTYRSEKYNYSIQYPPEWIMKRTDNVADTLEYIAFTNPTLSDAALATVAIQVKAGSYSEELERVREDIGAEAEQSITMANTNGRKFFSSNVQQGPGPKVVAYVLPFNSSSLLITVAPEQEGKHYSEIIEQMLSTLSLVK